MSALSLDASAIHDQIMFCRTQLKNSQDYINRLSERIQILIQTCFGCLEKAPEKHINKYNELSTQAFQLVNKNIPLILVRLDRCEIVILKWDMGQNVEINSLKTSVEATDQERQVVEQNSRQLGREYTDFYNRVYDEWAEIELDKMNHSSSDSSSESDFEDPGIS